MNRNPQVCSARVGQEVLLDAEESELVRCRDTAVCPYVENSELARDKTPESPLEISPYSNNPEISEKLQNSMSGSGKSTDEDDSQLVCNSQLGSDEDLSIGPSEDDEDDADDAGDADDEDDDEDDYQSGVQIIEILKTPRGVVKVTRVRSEINMRKKRWEDKLNAYKGLVERNHELHAIYEENRLAVAAGLAEVTREMDELGCWPDDVPEGPGDGADGNEMALVEADEKLKSFRDMCTIC